MHSVRSRLGILYATAERFGPPRRVPFDGRLEGGAFGPAAPQAIGGPLGEIVPGMNVGSTDEDSCLTLNVWAPEGAEALPVLVWFHGGSFVIGASSQPVYDGAVLAAEQDVVVVTVNYRLGAFGFLDARPLGGVANCGVRDALAALAWVHEHIASFGGDPARVVAFGESAGGGLIAHLLTSDAATDLLAGAIIQSGVTFATLDTERAAVVRDALVHEAGVDDPGELRGIPADELVAAQSRAMGTLLGTVGMMPFHPMIDDDVVAGAPTDGLAFRGPIVVGTTADEMALFVDRSAPGPPLEKLVTRVARYLGVDDERARGVVASYAGMLETGDTAVIWRAVFGDREMQVPARVLCEHHDVVWTYCFTWEGPGVGACHGIDIPFTFGNFGDGWDAFVALDDDGRALSARLRDAWARFAREGAPRWSRFPAARIFGRHSVDADAHPLFARSAELL